MSLKQPVRYPVKYYSHLDAGAPQYSNIDGAVKTILKACLVTGYGEKSGAGWTSVFDNANRIVLMRPLSTGNPPYIKIENGGGSHRIVSQDNPVSIDDSTELHAVPLLSRDQNFDTEWWVVACDFGFMMGFQVGQDNYSTKERYLMYVGGMKKYHDSVPDAFFVSYHPSVSIGAGTTITTPEPLTSNGATFRNMRTGANSKIMPFLNYGGSDKEINNEFMAQKLLMEGFFEPPFLTSIFQSHASPYSEIVELGGRPFLRYVENKPETNMYIRSIFIPLDYWEY